MNLDDLKDNVKSQLAQTWSRIEDSSAYNQLRDRFENLTPPQQKLTLMGVGALLALMIISVPYSYYTQATDYVSTFEDKRSLIRELLKVSRESNEVPSLPPAPSGETLKSSVENLLRTARLLPEQMNGIEVMAAETNLVPKNLLEAGLKVRLGKLNLRQIVDLGYGIQNISPSVKMNALNINANSEDPRYFDVEMKLVTLAVPQIQMEIPEPPDEGSGKNRKPFNRGNR